MVAAVVCDGGSGEEEDGGVQAALVQFHHRAVAVAEVGLVRPGESPGLGVQRAVELLGPTQPSRLSGLQLRPGGARQGRRLGGRSEES